MRRGDSLQTIDMPTAAGYMIQQHVNVTCKIQQLQQQPQQLQGHLAISLKMFRPTYYIYNS